MNFSNYKKLLELKDNNELDTDNEVVYSIAKKIAQHKGLHNVIDKIGISKYDILSNGNKFFVINDELGYALLMLELTSEEIDMVKQLTAL